MTGPWRVTFDTNPDDCNLHCRMCEQHSDLAPRRIGPPRRMPFDLARSVVEELRPHGLREIIPSTMGEPLLYRHMDAILDLCAATGVRLNLTTNGTFPGRGAAAWARRIVPVTTDVKVSWNGARAATAEAVMRGIRFDRAVEGVRALAAERDRHAQATGWRCRLTFQVTFLADTVEELPDVVRLAASLGVDRVKGHHVWTHFPALEPLSMRREEAVPRWNRVVGKTRRIAADLGVLLENVVPLAPGASEDLDPDATCPFLDREAWVAWDGRFHPCCAPDADRRALGDFGIVLDRPLLEIWRSPAYRALVRDHRDHPLCRRCNMRRREAPCGA